MNNMTKEEMDKLIVSNAKAYAKLKCNKTLAQVEMEIGVQPGYFGRVLNREIEMGVHAALKLAYNLGLSLPELMEMNSQLMHVEAEIAVLEEKLDRAKALRESLLREPVKEQGGKQRALTEQEGQAIAEKLYKTMLSGTPVSILGSDIEEVEGILARHLQLRTYVMRPTMFNKDTTYTLVVDNISKEALMYLPFTPSFSQAKQYRSIRNRYVY